MKWYKATAKKSRNKYKREVRKYSAEQVQAPSQVVREAEDDHDAVVMVEEVPCELQGSATDIKHRRDASANESRECRRYELLNRKIRKHQ